MRVLLSNGMSALVDRCDYLRVQQCNWWLDPYRETGYAVTEMNGRTVRMHNLITGLPYVDHINHDGLDNRRNNLREANHATNQQNSLKRIGTVSQYKGVAWHKANRKWTAQIRVDKKLVYLGSYTSEVDAALAYDVAAVRHFGEFANPNFGGVSNVG